MRRPCIIIHVCILLTWPMIRNENICICLHTVETVQFTEFCLHTFSDLTHLLNSFCLGLTRTDKKVYSLDEAWRSYAPLELCGSHCMYNVLTVFLYFFCVNLKFFLYFFLSQRLRIYNKNYWCDLVILSIIVSIILSLSQQPSGCSFCPTCMKISFFSKDSVRDPHPFLRKF